MGATAVAFNGTAAGTFSVVSDTQITATVPGAATSGPISVTTPNGTGLSAASFTVTAPPAAPSVTSFLPASGIVGSGVTVTGSGFTGATAVKFNGVAASFAVLSDTRVNTVVPTGATSGPISVTTPNGTGTSSGSFTVTLTPPPPTVSELFPTSGTVGSTVTVRGAGFSGATAVKFNGVPATSFSVTSDTELTATVPAGATTGPVSVTTANGTGTSAGVFTVTLLPPAPQVTGFLPASGVVGSTVTVSGAAFTGATAVTFNGSAATTFTVQSDTAITVTVPAGATSGPIAVTTPYGTGASAGTFTVTLLPPAPTVTGFTPASGPAGTTVTVTGLGFANAQAVSFNGLAAARFTAVSDTKLTAVVPAGATNGRIAVTTQYGTGLSAGSFVVTPAPKPKPVLTSVSPKSGKRGTVVTVKGTGFGAKRSGGTVTFGGVACKTYTSWSDTRVTCKVPTTAKIGSVNVRVITGGGTSATKTFTVTRK